MAGRGREIYFKVKPFLIGLSKLCNLFPVKVRIKLFESVRMIKGKKGIAIRYIFLKSLCKECGDNVGVREGVYIYNPQKLSLGNNVSINPMCYLDALGEIKIGNDVSIAHGVTIMSTSHNYEDLECPIKDQGCKTKNVIIENNVWIGAKATILYGIKIGQGSIIGANAVVTKDVESGNIVGGVPAKFIKKRGF